MKIVSAKVLFLFLVFFFTACVKDPYPVPAASTVSKFTYTVNNDGYAPATATFTNTSIVPTTVGDAYYSWSFGDGYKSTEENPVHTFTSPGSYTVTLTVKTSISMEVKEYSETIVILNANASGILVYFTDGSNVYSGYLNNDTPAFTALPIGPFDDSYGMAIDTINSKLYISDSGTGKIYRYDTETKDIIEFRTGLSGPDGLAIDFNAGKLYWDTDNGIQRTNLSSTTVTDVEDFITGQTNDPEGVSIDTTNSKLYWVCYDGGLWSISLDGSGKTQLLSAPEGGSTLVVGNKLFFDYWVASGDIHIKSSDLDGSNMGTITTGISKVVFGLAHEATTNKIYWGDRSNGKIMRANLDGSGVETWYSASGSSPRGICFGKKK
jgi:PKD repeat protein